MASIKKCLEQFTGQDQAREDAKKQAARLVKDANMKLDNLEKTMQDMFRNKELESQVQIVGDRMGAFAREYRVNYEDGNISAAVDSLIDQIMDIGSEKATKIISKAIKNGINAMFTSVSVNEEDKRMFVVLLEGAAMVRYDIWIWRYTEEDKALFSHVESVVAMTYARSVVDHTRLTEDELNDGIYRCLGGASLQEIIAYKKELLELFKLKVNDALCAEPEASLPAEELNGQLNKSLMKMIRATAGQAAKQAAKQEAEQEDEQLQLKAAVSDPLVRELLVMDTGKYKLSRKE